MVQVRTLELQYNMRKNIFVPNSMTALANQLTNLKKHPDMFTDVTFVIYDPHQRRHFQHDFHLLSVK
jgi:hypothetical protein